MSAARHTRQQYLDLHRRYYATSVAGGVFCTSCGSAIPGDVLVEEHPEGLYTYCLACMGE